jgi:ribose transport system substrate-binding protein
MPNHNDLPINSLSVKEKAGRLSRRGFVTRLGALGLGTIILTACGDAATAPAATPVPTKASVPTVGLVLKSLNNQFFIDMRDGAVKYQQQQKTFTLLTSGIQTETDIDGQASLVEDYIKRKVDAIVIAPADSYGLVPVLAKAVKAGIKVINIDVKLDDNSMKDAGFSLTFVGPDNSEGAKLAGDALAKALGKGGKVIILEGNPGAENATQRKNGFLASVKDGGLTLLDTKSAHWETEEARTVFTNMMSAHSEIQGVMCSNDAMLLGVVKVLEATGNTGKIKVIGFDNIPNVQPLIKDKKVLATVDQFGSQQAIFGIDNALKLISGQQVSGWIKTPVKLITETELV